MKTANKSRVMNEWRHLKKNHELLILGLPGVAYIFLFSYVPMFGVVLAFKDFKYNLGILGSEWVGFKNFEFFFVSEYAYRIIRNTVLYEIGYIILTTFFALMFAVMLNELSRNSVKVYQTTLFLPHFLSWVVVFYIVYSFLDINNGLLNKFLISLGLSPHNWYVEPEPWPYILNVVALWKRVGFSTLVYYAGIIAINSEYYDAAKIDGATRWQIARNVTIPMIMPLISILLILSIGSLIAGDFGLHYFIPDNSGLTYPTTDIIDTYVYRALVNIGDVGMGAAVGLFQSAVGLVLIVIANVIVRKINSENSLW